MYVLVEDFLGMNARLSRDNPHSWLAEIDTESDWQKIRFDLSYASAAGVNLNQLRSIAIGFGSGIPAGQPATVRIDELKLVQSGCSVFSAADMTRDCKVDIYDFALLAAEWLDSTQWP